MELFDTLGSLLPGLTQPLARLSLDLSIALALATCLFGFRLRKAWYTLVVFLVAAIVAYALCAWLLPEQPLWQLGIALLAGILVSTCTYRLFQGWNFVVAFYCAFVLVQQWLAGYGTVLATLAALVAGIVIGVLAAKHQYKVIILTTAVSGGWRAAAGLAQRLSLTANTMYLLAAIVIVAGLIIQFATTRRLR